MAFIISTTYPQIRAALGAFVDTETLPDSMIALDIYAGRADDWVRASDPAWASRTGDALQRLVRAAILYCAALLAPAMPAISTERFGDYQYSAQVDWERRATDLMGEAAQALATVVGTMRESYAASTFFTKASGGRGR